MNQLYQHSFYQNIRDLIVHARKQSYRAVNAVMLKAYWNIGRLIVEEEQEGKARAIYGRNLIPTLSKQLAKDFGKGFNSRNLHYMCAFYRNFSNLNAVRSELTWTHYRSVPKANIFSSTWSFIIYSSPSSNFFCNLISSTSRFNSLESSSSVGK